MYPLVGGRLRRVTQPDGSLTEVGLGTRGLDAVLACRPQVGRVDRRPHRIVIQTRTDVVLRLTLDGVGSGDFPGNVALCAFGDPEDTPLTWVQTGRFVPEQVEWFDGRRETRTLTRETTYYGESRPTTEPLRDPQSRETFVDRAQQWWIDSRSESARYSDAGSYLPPAGHPNGEIIYDGPSQSVRYGGFLHDNPGVRRIRAPIEFKTYLYRRPQSVRGFPRMRPLAMVEWWFTDVLERPSPGAAWTATPAPAEILWIIPNPVEPTTLDAAFSRYTRL